MINRPMTNRTHPSVASAGTIVRSFPDHMTTHRLFSPSAATPCGARGSGSVVDWHGIIGVELAQWIAPAHLIHVPALPVMFP